MEITNVFNTESFDTQGETCTLIRYDATDSTQLRAKELLRGGKVSLPFCVVAKTQTGGYGQSWRPYYCPAGGLYMSLVLPAKDFMYLFATGFVAVCVARVIGRVKTCDRVLSIKWVNDILLDDKKVGGIIIERVGGNFVIGIGINLIKTQSLPNELKDRMGFVNPNVTSDDILECIITEITSVKLTDEQVFSEYRALCNVDGLNIDGSVATVDAEGRRVKKFGN